MNLNWVIEIDKDSIDKLKFDFPEENTFWQSKGWVKAILKSEMAEKVFIIPHYDTVIRTHKALIVEKRQVAMWEFGLFALWVNSDLDDYETSLVALCKRENALFVQIEDIDYDWLYDIDTHFMRKGSYKKFIEPWTAVIDLTKSEAEILAAMKPKGRYNIKVARKKWVDVREYEATDKNIDKFYSLLEETTERNNFAQNSKKYFKKFLKKVDWAKLYLAKSNSDVVAGWIFVQRWDAFIYYYGASTSNPNYRSIMSPYLLQMTAILDAKNAGARIYDFLWVAKPSAKGVKLSGVTDFKMKLTNDARFVSDSYIFVNKKLKYALIKFLKFIKSFKK